MRAMRTWWTGGIVAIVLLPWATAGAAADPIEPRAGTWKTWVLGSGSALRLPAPPDAQTTAGELREVVAQAARRDAAALERARYWDFASPSYRWNEMLTDTAVATNMGATAAVRAFTMLNLTLGDAMIAAWDSKSTHGRPRPAAPGFVTAVPPPSSPSYPCEHAVAAGAAAAVLAHLFPNEAARFAEAADDAARSRVVAGVAYPSDVRAGLDLGRAVAARVIDAMRLDGKKSAGTVPVGPGLWQGNTIVGIDEMRWKLFVLSSADQFRPGPPPAPGSPERAAEIAEVKNFKRTPATNAKVYYWQFGQQGGGGLLLRLGEEVGRQLAEAGLDRNPPRAARAYALVHLAHYEAYVASQDAKFHYWTARPSQFDATISPAIPTPPFPSYPSNAATLGTASTLVLAHLFPREAARYASWAQEFGESRLWAGIHFRSDIRAGDELGRQVAGAVIERARRDGAE